MQKGKSRKISIIIPIIIVVFALLGLVFWLNRTLIFDTFSAWAFHPSAEIAAIEDKISLTPHGELIFEATSPSLESRESFNERCKSHNQDISVLGCYTNNNIYIYNIQSADLAGVIESTAAHELLHAAWKRLSGSEKTRLSKYITAVYEDEKYHNLLVEDLETYSDFDRIDELHSRIGTEIAELPDELEKHYAKYFMNQDLVVDYYNNYIEPFRELADEIEQLSKQLAELDSEIETKTSEYHERSDSLAKQIDEFNACVKTRGCFTTESQYNSTRNALLQSQSELEDMYTDLNDRINEYNSLVSEYNANVIRGEELEKEMNSNSKQETIITN